MATQDDIAALLRRIDYRSVDLRDVDSVAAAVSDLVHRKCVSYLAIPPGLYISTCEGLAKGGALAAPARLMLEKPIGSDSESAEIISTIGQWIDEDRVFRLDHYLGKAAVQNLIALRFGNTLLEAVWNRNYIESVHILVAESEGVDGRDAYYARSGALRDMVQSHILQLLCMVAMEPPASLEADRIRDEKVKVLRALRPLDAKHAARDSIRAATPPAPSTASRRRLTSRRKAATWKPSPVSPRISTTGAGAACRSIWSPASACPSAPPAWWSR